VQNELKIALVQTQLIWEDPVGNRDALARKIHGIHETVDLIVLPEMFSTGFTMDPSRVAETMVGDTLRWMKYLAANKGTALVGSIVIAEDEHFYNRLLFVHPTGDVEHYDKRHTFTLAGEDRVYASGSERLIVTYKGWRFCPLICYDLRFPVWSRNTDNYDALIYVANWPTPRITAWDALLKARAIENMSYCIGVNRVGLDNNGHFYPGHSVVYDGLGNDISDIDGDMERVDIITLSKSHLETIREKLRFLDDKDDFIVK
jgi:predicted amidohydrolase